MLREGGLLLGCYGGSHCLCSSELIAQIRRSSCKAPIYHQGLFYTQRCCWVDKNTPQAWRTKYYRPHWGNKQSRVVDDCCFLSVGWGRLVSKWTARDLFEEPTRWPHPLPRCCRNVGFTVCLQWVCLHLLAVQRKPTYLPIISITHLTNNGL